MAKRVYSKDVHDNFEAYEAFVNETKFIEPGFVVNGKGIKHKDKRRNIIGEVDVECSQRYGDTIIRCEVKSDDNLKYSISLMGDDLDTRILTRLDSDGGNHRNYSPGTPYHEQLIPSPHFHIFSTNGYFVAEYAGIEGNDAPGVDIDKGFTYFCKRNKIIVKDGMGQPSISIQTALPLEDISDPNFNVEFKTQNKDEGNI